MKKYILALDEGTTSTRAIIFDKNCNTVCSAQHEFKQFYPNPGWVEQDAAEIFASQLNSLNECLVKSGISPEEIAGIGITNQRETTVVWNKNTGKPVYNAIVWQCRRTADICEKLISDGYSEYIENTTGLRPDAYFSATKIKWVLDNVEGARDAANRNELLFGTVDTWLVWKLTGGKVHITDRTNASRTMLYNIEKDEWDEKLLSILNIPVSMLPKVCSSSEIYGYTEIMGASVPICGIAGDQQAALFGQQCFCEGDAKITYGTGCFLLANTGEKRLKSNNGLLTTLAATLKGEPLQYALEGSVFIGGAVIQWLRDELGFINKSSECETYAGTVEDSGGVYLVPAFAGLGAPYWDMHARGIITGLTRGTNKAHIIRAAIDSMAYQSNDVITAIGEDLGKKINTLKCDGGATVNNLLMQFQADISDMDVIRSAAPETTALGAAYLAGLSCGLFKDRESLATLGEKPTLFKPKMSEEKRREYLNGWHNAVNQCRK